jgi:predicted transcriptional regulator
MFEKLKAIESVLDKRIITYEFEIISNLYPNKVKSSTELWNLSNSSYSTFYIIIKSMVSEGTLVICKTETDKRLRLYKLNENLVEQLAALNLT